MKSDAFSARSRCGRFTFLPSSSGSLWRKQHEFDSPVVRDVPPQVQMKGDHSKTSLKDAAWRVGAFRMRSDPKSDLEAVQGNAISHRSMKLPAFFSYNPEADGLRKRLRASFAPAADGPFGRIFK